MEQPLRIQGIIHWLLITCALLLFWVGSREGGRQKNVNPTNTWIKAEAIRIYRLLSLNLVNFQQSKDLNSMSYGNQNEVLKGRELVAEKLTKCEGSGTTLNRAASPRS